MFFRRASKHRRSLRLLVKLIATEKDRHQLISRVASDARLLKQAQRLYCDRQNKTIGKQDHLIELCRVYQIGPDHFDEQLRLIVYILNLVEHHEDYYKELGLEHDAGRETIKHAFRQLCLAYHPDRISNSSDALEKFLRIRRAYEILSNDKLRREYDRRFAMPPWTEDSVQENMAEASFWQKRRLYRMVGWAILLALLLAFSIGIDYQDWQTIRYYGPKQDVGMWHDRTNEHESLNSGGANPLANNGTPAKDTEGSREDTPTPPTSSLSLKELPQPQMNAGSLITGEFSQPGPGTEDLAEASAKKENDHSKAVEGGRKGFPLLKTGKAPGNADATISRVDERHANDGKPSKKGLVDSSHSERESGERSTSSSVLKSPAFGDEKTLKLDASGKPNPSQELNDRIQVFLNRYAHAYEQRNLSVFIELFEPGALENGEGIADLVPVYRETFQQAERIHYKLRLLTWYSSGNHIDVNANARLSLRMNGQPSWESNGFVHLRLVQRGNDFRVRSINYSFR